MREWGELTISVATHPGKTENAINPFLASSTFTRKLASVRRRQHWDIRAEGCCSGGDDDEDGGFCGWGEEEFVGCLE